MKVPFSPEVLEKLNGFCGDVAIPMLNHDEPFTRPLFVLRLAQKGDPNGEFPQEREFPVAHRFGLFRCDYGVLLHVILLLGERRRRVYARFDLSLAQAVDWLRCFCCVDNVLIGIVDQDLESITAFQLAWPEASRLELHNCISEGLRFLANIPHDMLNAERTVDAFNQYKPSEVV